MMWGLTYLEIVFCVIVGILLALLITLFKEYRRLKKRLKEVLENGNISSNSFNL